MTWRIAIAGLIWVSASLIDQLVTASSAVEDYRSFYERLSTDHRVLSSNERPSLPAGIDDPKPRIIQGDRSDPSQRRFFARTGYDPFPQTSEVICGATLVSRDIALSAAHCQGGFNYGIRILDPLTNDFTRLVNVERQIRHPKWDEDRMGLNFDILVLKLEQSLDENDVAQPIPYNTDPSYPLPGQTALAMGYGITENNAVSPVLLEAEMKYISNDECWGRRTQFNNVRQSEEILCTDPVDGSSTCLGDSGGPLTNVNGDRLLGIVSFGSGCQADATPDGFVRLSAVSDWILEQICEISDFPPSNCPKQGRNSLETKMGLYFNHDFWSDETTFAVRKKPSGVVVYTGPQYTPERGESAKSEFYLLPGEYTFEVFDTDGNGLQGQGQGDDGSWRLVVIQNDGTETQVASGDAYFIKEQYTSFTVAKLARPNPTSPMNPELNSSNSAAEEACLVEKSVEERTGSSTCNCNTAGIITCRNSNGQVCKPLYQQCAIAADCCGNRACRAGFCRVRNDNSRESAKLGGNGIGGAPERRGGKLLLRGRRRLQLQS